MESRVAAALASIIASQAILIMIILRRSLAAPSPAKPSLLHLAVTTSHIAASASLISRKRKQHQIRRNDEIEDPCGGGGDGQIVVDLPRASPDDFKQWFRMSSRTFEWLSGLLDPLLDCRDPAGSSLRLPGPARLGAALARLSAGLPYPVVAARFGISERAARFCARRLCRVLCTNFRFWLAFPPAADLSGFLSIAGLGDCCGAVSCARFGNLAVQIVVDSSSRILSISAGFRGSRTDSQVLKLSSLYKDVKTLEMLRSSQYFVGDGDYPLLPWLMVPFGDPARGSCEEDFNSLHRLLCRPARRAVASLRSWGVLGRLMEEEGKAAAACVGACAILHNVMLMREDYTALADTQGDYPVVSARRRDDGDVEYEDEALALRRTLATRAKEICRSSGGFVCRLKL